MKIRAVGETFAERVLVWLGLVPAPLLETQMAYTLARTIMLGVRSGVFEALAEGPLPARAVANGCETHEWATSKLLDALAGAGYLRRRGETYELTRGARKWLLESSPHSLRDKLLLQFREWDWLGHYDDFLRTGTPLDMHRSLSGTEWPLYQKGLGSLARLYASEVARRTPVPEGARDLLDVGGALGHHAAALCRRHPALRAVVLDLPEALAQAGRDRAGNGAPGPVSFRAGNVLHEDLGSEAWDVIFMSQLAHHFDEATNREIARRAARALRRGGVFVVQELVRGGKKPGQTGGLLDLYFAATSRGGTWSVEEIADWQRRAGLTLMKPIRFRRAPGIAQQAASRALSGSS
jgi:SAM-dependent methyltransferase